MVFTKKLRERVKKGLITTSIRIWQKPHVKVGGSYKMEEGNIIVSSIREISFEDISDAMAKESGFMNKADLLKTAKHGPGEKIYFIRFRYEEGSY